MCLCGRGGGMGRNVKQKGGTGGGGGGVEGVGWVDVVVRCYGSLGV